VFLFREVTQTIQASRELQGVYPFIREKVPGTITGKVWHCENGLITLVEYRSAMESELGSRDGYDFTVYEVDNENNELEPFLSRWEKMKWKKMRKKCRIS